MRNAHGEPRTLPLAADLLFGVSLGLGLNGVLDAAGRGASRLTIPPDPTLAGLSLWSAGIVVAPAGRLDLTEEEPVLLTR